jgi:outer membrane protein
MRNFRRNLLVGALVATGTMLGTLGAGVAAEAAPAASIVIIDSQKIQRDSLAGKDIVGQFDAIRTQVQSEIQGEEDKLRGEEDELKRQRDILSPDAFEAKRQAFEQKVADVQRKVQEKNAQLRTALDKANGELQRAVMPILNKMLESKNATLMIDKGQIIVMAPNKGLDVTTDVIEQLDRVLPGVKVDFSNVSIAGGAAAAAAPAPAPAKKN